tara:strand:- start:235 stop:513 length:279 start_codon:yes stop_codon:yes gene_type:complete
MTHRLIPIQTGPIELDTELIQQLKGSMKDHITAALHIIWVQKKYREGHGVQLIIEGKSRDWWRGYRHAKNEDYLALSKIIHTPEWTPENIIE